MHAYYYIDNVKIGPVDAKSQCNCSSSKHGTDLVYGGHFAQRSCPAEVVERTSVYYAFVNASFTEDGKATWTDWRVF